MFVGRERELASLNRMYRKPGFQMAVVYGRRRVGKTTLLDRFIKGKPTLYFTAQQKSVRQNLENFSASINGFFSTGDRRSFDTWAAALSFVATAAARRDAEGKEPFVFVFDEFPYAAEMEPALPSILQIAIDREFKGTNARIILCGSNEGFMEGEVLGRKSPLYGRRTMQLRILPFDYLDAARMLRETSDADRINYYATFGGTPYYLEQIDTSLTYEENVKELLFDPSGLLYEEPLMLLRQELREPANYNSVLDAIGGGETAPHRIADKSGIRTDSLSKYLKTLRDLRIIRRDVPFGERAETSRKGIYVLDDPFFAYWYRFVSRSVGEIEAGAGAIAADQKAFGSDLATYVGHQFETVCRQWLIRKNSAGGLPFLASRFGSWWGTDPRKRERVDIDIVAADGGGKNLLLGECKWRESVNESEAIKTLEERRSLIDCDGSVHYALFSKRPFSSGTLDKMDGRGNWHLVSLGDLFSPDSSF